MHISRRNFFRQMTMGAALSATTWRLNELPQAAAQGQTGSRRLREPMRLDMNINPYGPSPKVVEVMRANLESVSSFPDSDYGPLVERIAEFHKVKLSQMTLGSGSREIMRMAMAAYLTRGGRLVLASPTFEPLANFVKQVGAEVTAVPLTKYYAHDLDAMLHQTNALTGLIYICNPNNPTASLTPRKDLEAFLEKLPPKVVVVIDEAYHDYVSPSSDYASFIDHPVDDKRVIVVRTFSKIYGLAGLRLGYAVSSEEVSSKLAPMQLDKGINILAAQAAATALGDLDYVRLSARRNENERQEFYNQRMARMLRQIDSRTNFVFLKVGLPSSQVIELFEQNNIMLGPAFPQMDKYVRVALSTQENMREFWRVYDLLPSSSHKMASNQVE
jgi:histidinol-phosphate aminotransferase